MTTYSVQFELPVDNPERNVSIRRGKGSVTFFVPINHPDAHNMGFQDLIAAAELSGLVRIVPSPNNKSGNRLTKTSRSE